MDRRRGGTTLERRRSEGERRASTARRRGEPASARRSDTGKERRSGTALEERRSDTALKRRRAERLAADTVEAQPKLARRTAERVAAGRSRSMAARRAYARRALREGRPAERIRRDEDHAAGRASFVVLIIALLTVGVAATLWLSTQAIADSYRLEDAKQAADELAERADELQRDVTKAESASSLAERAKAMGMVPAGDPARLVVRPNGRVVVVGEPTRAQKPKPPAARPPADGQQAGAQQPNGQQPDGQAQQPDGQRSDDQPQQPDGQAEQPVDQQPDGEQTDGQVNGQAQQDGDQAGDQAGQQLPADQGEPQGVSAQTPGAG